jgi:hypothetical protein
MRVGRRRVAQHAATDAEAHARLDRVPPMPHPVRILLDISRRLAPNGREGELGSLFHVLEELFPPGGGLRRGERLRGCFRHCGLVEIGWVTNLAMGLLKDALCINAI